MDKQFFFERNLLALSGKDPGLCSRLSGAETTLGRYKFLEARTGETVPALVDRSGAAHPLHSLVDPKREGSRLINSSVSGKTEGFLVLLGLGGGFYAEAALERDDIHRVLVIDYDINGIAELLASREYITLFKDPRFFLLVDPAPEALETGILETYQPALYGGIRLIPLRTRTDLDLSRFNQAGESVKTAIDRLSGDYSVQAYFGTRWFSNIIRNLLHAERSAPPLPPIHRALICAAGPSLDMQMPVIKQELSNHESGPFLIASDTSLPALLQEGIKPDAVVSIDCQHISYYHFMQGLPRDIPLFLDLASPPLLATRTDNPRFFAGGHPLTRYIARYWRPFPNVDTSGANVTYAALSLAEYLGAAKIELFGADFSYPQGKTYARGTYIYPYFEVRQNRLSPLEAQASAFLYRSQSLQKIPVHDGWCYVTPPLRGYREGVEAKARTMHANIRAAAGMGAPIILPRVEERHTSREPIRLFAAGKAAAPPKEFLAQYRADIATLPVPGKNLALHLESLDEAESLILTTLLPAAAALKRRRPELDGRETLEAARTYCLKELDLVLAVSSFGKGER
ncbi:hypothetical protein FACS189483_07620 [Spirochaetia bacterium]|nr:hypothetical protein FACS189483_07620 [Spirochaetia bacterium]